MMLEFGILGKYTHAENYNKANSYNVPIYPVKYKKRIQLYNRNCRKSGIEKTLVDKTNHGTKAINIFKNNITWKH